MPGPLIVNARRVNEGREFDGDIRFANGRITHVGGHLTPQPGDQVIEAGGRWVLPGMVVCSLGLALLVSPLTAAVLAAAPGRYAGAASGVNNAVARAGSLLAVAEAALLERLADPRGSAQRVHQTLRHRWFQWRSPGPWRSSPNCW
mgnify:CR=1 FL=1